METIKNFFTGLLAVIFAMIIIALGFVLWPIMIGIGSIMLFIAVIVLAFALGFYIIVLIGYVVRNSFKASAKKDGRGSDKKG